jgi:Spy/CpxP family protein refolding chaperone
MRTFGKAVLAIGMVALMAGPARAQGRGFGMFGGGGGVMLLSNKGVQKEVKATDEQVSKLDAFAEEMRTKQREAFQGFQDLSTEERRTKMQEVGRKIREDVNKGLADILKPEQVKRFQQIEIQSAGAQAFAMPNVQAALKLTDDQKSKLDGINQETMQAMRDAREEAGGDMEVMMKKGAEIRKKAADKALALLTDSQKATWKEMTGEPFEVKFEAPRPRN